MIFPSSSSLGIGGGVWTNYPDEKKGRYPKARHAHSMVSINDKIYMFGGQHSPDQKLGDLWCYKPLGPREGWSLVRTVGKTPAPRSGHAMLYLAPDSLVIWGGMLKVCWCTCTST